MKTTNEVICTAITLSPDGWKNVYLHFIETESQKEHLIVLPFEREEEYTDKETGETKMRKVKCMKAGNFSLTFRNEAIQRAIDTFAPGCLKEVLHFTNTAAQFGSPLTLSSIADLPSLIRGAKRLLDAYDALAEATSNKKTYAKEARAWRLYSSILYQFEHWA